jgi:hypothetical protein
MIANEGQIMRMSDEQIMSEVVTLAEATQLSRLIGRSIDRANLLRCAALRKGD